MNSASRRALIGVICCTLAGLLLSVSGCGAGSSTKTPRNDGQPRKIQGDAEARAVSLQRNASIEAAAVAISSEEWKSTDNGKRALQNAAQEGKYLFAFFCRGASPNGRPMRAVFDAAVKELGDHVASVLVNISEPDQREIVNEFELARAPMPLVLAIAPNGAVTGAFPGEFTQAELEGSIVSPRTAQCVKCLQENKLVFLCLQNDGTQFNSDAIKGIDDFKGSQKYPDLVEVVVFDPADPVEQSFLQDLQLSTQPKMAVTAILAPPGAVVGILEGPTSKADIVELLSKAQSPCAAGQCGPGGCGPAAN